MNKTLLTTLQMLNQINKGDSYKAVSHPERSSYDMGVTVKYGRDSRDGSNPDKISWIDSKGDSEDFPLNEYTLKYLWELVPEKRKAHNFQEAFDAYDAGKKIENRFGFIFQDDKTGNKVTFTEGDIRGEWYIYE
jgi:hypothetical protein